MRKIDVLLICLLGGFMLLACNLFQGGEVRGLGEARPPVDNTSTPDVTASPTPTQTKAVPTPTATIRARLKAAPPTATPIIAATPTPTPIPEPASEEPASMEGTVHVAADGSGDYPSLEEAVGSVPEGTTIILEAGTYRLAGTLEIAGSLSLEGAGMDQTEIVSDAEGHVVRFSGDGSFSAEGITFRHEGGAVADVVAVEGGEATFDGCRVTGAASGEEDGMAGLYLGGSATGVVRDCVAEANDDYGILMEDQAQVTLEGNTISGNHGSGIVCLGDTGGVVRGNDSSGNGKHGIAVAERAQPTLEGNTCASNEASGIAYFDSAGGVARDNTCTANQQIGILAVGQAQPTLEGNACAGNTEGGIWYADTASGVARGNECSGSGLAGIVVGGQAQPTLEGNTCAGNTKAGIYYTDTASGVARGNECSGNEFGIAVTGVANPELVDNNLHDNSVADIQDWRS